MIRLMRLSTCRLCSDDETSDNPGCAINPLLLTDAKSFKSRIDQSNKKAILFIF